ncbi:hypothetical protein BsWGS_02002 [Bradybaena similaris]
MDFDSSSKFIASLAKFLQSLCNGYVDFDKGVEVIGHIYINVDSDTGKKVDYVLNEKVCKNDNSITFISNSFHAQPAEKPKPPPKKIEEPDRKNDETFVMEDSGQPVPNSTNVGTLGSYRSPSARTGQQDSYPAGSKRPRSPPQRRPIGKINSPAPSKVGMPPSPRYHDSGGPAAKMGRSDILPSPLNSSSLGGSGDDYEGASVFQGDEDDNFSTSFLDNQNSSEDQKPVIDPDISIVKEEYMTNQSSCSYSGNNQTSGPGRGKNQPPASAYPVMLHQNPSNYATAAGSTAPQPDLYAGNLDGVGDPSTLTRAQQEELEMYYRKGTDQHLTFLRNMREAHAMYPFTGKRDKELFDKALAELFVRIPLLSYDAAHVEALLYSNSMKKMSLRRCRQKDCSQFKSPGRGGRGQQFGRQSFHGGQGFPYTPGGYPGHAGLPGMERRGSSAGSEGDASFLQAPGDESYDYQQLASDDSHDTQQSMGDFSQAQAGFHGAFGNGSSQQGGEARLDQLGGEGGDGGGQNSEGGAGSGLPHSPPDIKYEVTPMPFMKTNDFELIEIDPDDEDDI